MKSKTRYLFLLFSIIALGFNSCDDDDDIIDLEPTGGLLVEDQMLENNMLTISNVTMSEPGWVVIHRDNGNGGPMVPEIISIPQMVDTGSTMDVMVELKEGEEIEDGETLWAMLHTDDGAIGVYEFNGTNGLDAPIMDENDDIVTEPFTVSVAPMGTLMLEDQVLTDNTINVASVSFDRGGYVVVHASNAAGDGPMVPEIISEPVYFEAGDYSNIEVPLTDDANVDAGDTVWVMLHTDTGTEEVYEFDGNNGLDMPITDEEGNVVAKPLVITDVEMMPTGTLMVENQVLTNNHVNVASVNLGQAGYVVVHASNEAGDGPMVPEIISVPVYLEAGDYSNVEVPLTSDANVDAGDTVWVMLHNDTGTEEEYEFDGENGLDLPITDDEGNVVVMPVDITSVTMVAVTGALSINDQPVVENQLSVGSVNLSESGWVVVHASNEAGDGPMVPEIISEPMYLEAGINEDVMVTFKESANVDVGDTVWVMLHNDTGVPELYEFDGMNGLDLPIQVEGNIVVTRVDITE